MWQGHPVFPDVPSEFWQSFHVRWGKPLRLLEEIISISESLAADPTSPTFETMDKMYWQAIGSLHSRTCLHARSVLALLSYGLVDPALAQWRICHESSTIANFIAKSPEMASRYIQFSVVNKSHLVEELYDAGDEWALATSARDEALGKAKDVREDIRKTYGRKVPGKNYSWSGLQWFKEIETMVFQSEKFNPRAGYLLASQIIHSSPNAGEPVDLGDGLPRFMVKPIDFGLSGPIDLTSLSIVHVTQALMRNAAITAEDRVEQNELAAKCRSVGPLCWAADPVNFCQDCGGYKPISSPPDFVPMSKIPKPCSCK